jgi:molybdopterin converting factor small subunit
MIKVRAVGTVGTDLGKSLFHIKKESIVLRELIQNIFGKERTSNYTKPNTDLLIVVNGTAITDKSDEMILVRGDEVILIPITHGG